MIDNLKPADLLKMITTPVEKQRAKSYYLAPHGKKNVEDIKSLGSHSVRIDQKRNSKAKKERNYSIEKDNSYNNSKFFKGPTKSTKKV